MKYSLILLSILFTINLYSQDPKIKQAILEEGEALYKSEMASWNGSDLFQQKLADKMELVGGYFSYTEKEISKCIFFDRQESPQIIAEFSFDKTFNIKNAKVDTERKDFSDTEKDLYIIRNKAYELMNSDTLFKIYNNTNLNIIPLIRNNEKKVFVLTAPKVNGVVIFGNDYLISFDDDNKITSRKQLHNNIIPIEYSKEHGDDVSTMHSHNSTTGDYITSTDVCTLMLYSKYAKWNQHIVVTQKYMNMWKCETNTLLVMTNEAVKKIDDHINKGKKKEEKKKERKKRRKSKKKNN